MSAEQVTKKQATDATNEPMVQYASGAKRSKHVPDYSLIPRAGLRRLAERFSLGMKKYKRNNWRLGLKDPEYIEQFKNHINEHLLEYFESGNAFDDNLAAIVWGCFALMEAEEVADRELAAKGIAIQ